MLSSTFEQLGRKNNEVTKKNRGKFKYYFRIPHMSSGKKYIFYDIANSLNVA